MMLKREATYACPVCRVSMSKVRPSGDVDLMLDYCGRCGGMWFDQGEAAALRKCSPKALNTTIVLSDKAYMTDCRSCGVPMKRNDDSCPTCGWQNVIHCPVSETPLDPTERGSVKVDVCSQCHGVWFDNTELAEIWNRKVAAVAEGKLGKSKPQDHFFLVDVIDCVIYRDPGQPGLLGAATGLIRQAPGAAGSIAGRTGKVAGSVARLTGGLAGALFEFGEDAVDVIEISGEVAGGVFGGIGEIVSIFDV